MPNLQDYLNDVRQNRRGAVAMIVAIGMPVLIGASALAIDIANLQYVDNRMQSAADAAAIVAVNKLSKPSDAVAAAVDYAARNVPGNFGTVTTNSDVTVGIWDAEAATFTASSDADLLNAVRVQTRRGADRQNAVPTILMQYLGKSSSTITAQAIAARQLVVQYEPPEHTNLDPDAGDFNELYVYCFNYQGTGTVESRRSQMTLISNNMPAGQNIKTISNNVVNAVPANPLVWPECGKGQSLSFRLRNIRHAKSWPALWANANATVQTNPTLRPGRPEYNYHTDTSIADGVETFGGLGGKPILQTVRCDTANLCDPKKTGNIIPVKKNSTSPALSGKPCMPGKYMYFGWEDRPPGQSGAKAVWTDPAWTDGDFNDIHIRMRCPRSGMLGDGMTRLVG